MSKKNKIVKKDNNKNTFKIILLGDAGTGKTSLINAFFNKDFNEKIYSTLSPECSKKEITIDGNKYIIDIWDTAGQEKFSSLTKIFVKGSHIIIFVYDITNEKTFNHLIKWVNIVEELLWENPTLGLVGNKIDLLLDQQVSEENGIKYAKEINAIFCETSAKENKKGFQNYLTGLIKNYIINNKEIKVEEKLLLKNIHKSKKKC